MPRQKTAADRNPLADGCKGCFYLSTYFGCCNYLIYTGKRRPCPGGKDCTVKSTQTPKEFEKVILWDTVLAQELYKQGATDTEIAKACHAPIGEVRSFRRRHMGAANRQKGEKAPGRQAGWDTETAHEMYKNGATDRDIAEALGVPQEKVRNYRANHWGKSNYKRAFGWDTEAGRTLYEQGKSDGEIAEALHTTKAAVAHYRARNWGLKPRTNVLTWDAEKAKRMREEGASYSQIAEAVGTTKGNVQQYARRHWREDDE